MNKPFFYPQNRPLGLDVKKYLLALAKDTIAKELELPIKDPVRPKSVDSEILNEKRGVFVTLDIGGNLRGCIGNIMPVYPLEEAVKRNSVHAAFEDPRFQPLDIEEFKDVEIEISALSVPEKLEYKNAEDLLKKLTPLKDGVVIKKGYYDATYLPQVWIDLADKKQFLSSLCMKAGLSPDEWQKGDLEVLTYQAEVFKESELF